MTPRLARRAFAALLGLGLAVSPHAARAAADPMAAVASLTSPVSTIDAFDDVGAWSAHPADGVVLAIRRDEGRRGGSLRLDFRFEKGGGYAVVRRAVSLDLPANYRIAFDVRGRTLPQNLELKLIDSTGANVWWSNQRDYAFPAEWRRVSLKKRHITFAWGPAGGGELRHVGSIEFAITAGSGGEGTVWLDELTLEALPPPDATPPTPVATASSFRDSAGPGAAVDRDSASAWRSDGGDRAPWLVVDLRQERELGGLLLRWERDRHLSDYDVALSADSVAWRTVRRVREGDGGFDPIALPETETRFLRIASAGRVPSGGVGLLDLAIQPLAWAATPADFARAVAALAPRGHYPRALAGEQTYWTVVGRDGGRSRDVALLSEDGVLETGRGQFSIEPFLVTGDRLIGWNDARITPSLEDGRLPIPSVRWARDSLELTVTAFAGGPAPAPVIGRWRVRNVGPRRTTATLALALRPFQVNPPWQFLNQPGGVAPIRTIARTGRVVTVNGERRVTSLTRPAEFTALTFDEGDLVERLAQGRLPRRERIEDPTGAASGVLLYRLDLPPGATREVALVLGDAAAAPEAPAAAQAWVAAREAWAHEAWNERLGRTTIVLPDTAAMRTLEAQVGYLLVNRDSVALQPGTRSYARSWIRDGALSSSALLRMGHANAVRAFIDWFAPFQYADGKVPCCVDARGADPVPEHDSSGEFVFLVAEYFRFTGDTALAARHWPAVRAAALYLDSLRQQRRTAEWKGPGKAPFFGLLPPSISHEGYSAKPMHSYWDDFFALKGFKDATFLAGALGHADDARRLAGIRDEFQRELLASLDAAMKAHKIDYLPGCADLGDFDATSTTIALNPVGAGGVLPRAALEHTFERYYAFFRDRRDGKNDWEAFTPYEVRTIGAFVQLGWRDRAHDLLAYFLGQRRPPGFAHWAEVVFKDPRAPRFIGDMPHTWVGSDYVRSVLDMLAYSSGDTALVLGAGVSWAWASRGGGVAVRALRTPFGSLGYTLKAVGDAIEVRIADGLRVPPGGIVVRPPAQKPFRSARIGDQPAALSSDGAVIVRTLPAVVRLSP